MPDSVEVGTYDYPHDRYNLHYDLRRLLAEIPMESDDRVSYERLSAESDPGKTASRKLRTEQRIGEDDDAEEQKRLSVNMK